MTKRRTQMKCTRNALYSHLVSEMKHIQKEYKAKMYITRESASQNVAFVGERNDEERTVPSVMKVTEKLTDEEVDEMILETDADETHCPQQLFDVPVHQTADSGSCHSIPQERIMERIVVQIVNMSEHTHTQSDEEIVKDSQSLATSYECTGCEDCLRTRSSSELVNKL